MALLHTFRRAFAGRVVWSAALLGALAACSTAPPRQVVIDTDAGADDLIAIAWLLKRPEVQITGIVTVAGIREAEAGATEVRRLLELDGRTAIPVTAGTDGLEPAYQNALARKGAATVLALGPLTNLARLLAADPAALDNAAGVVVMGGAIRAPGNLSADDPLYNEFVEWNVSRDPEAARTVLTSQVPITLVPLDATNMVGIDDSYIDALAASDGLGRYVHDLLAAETPLIGAGAYYAWDPLAASSLVKPELLEYECGRFAVSVDRATRGRTTFRPESGSKQCFAARADGEAFRASFLETFR